MKSHYLKIYIIEPVLQQIGLYSAINLLLGTAAQESHMGRYVYQIGFAKHRNDGAFGLYGTELFTENDHWKNFLKYRPTLAKRVDAIRDHTCSRKQSLVGDPFYATAMARIHYLRVKEPLPDSDDIEGMANYWKNLLKIIKNMCAINGQR
jgi:hypothetical protein